MTRPGGVVWVTGLSGTGKTTVANGVCERLRSAGDRPVLLDGDALRAILPVPVGHERRERHDLAMFYARLARDLAAQGQLVVCATVSLFHDVHAWNRRNIDRYLEVWLRVPADTLRRRRSLAAARPLDRDPALSRAVDASAELPSNPDMVIDNHGTSTADGAADEVVAALRAGTGARSTSESERRSR